MIQLKLDDETKVDPAKLRKMVSASLKAYARQFTAKYGKMVICCDDKDFWRKEIFPHYKAMRKTYREKSPYNWVEIFDAINAVKEELKQNVEYVVIQIARAEADDIIGAICNKYGRIYNGEYADFVKQLNREKNILIISGDKDFGQLQKYMDVEQFCPIKKEFIRINNPAKFLHEHIMRGDRGDGIPNFLSEDASFVNGIRQKSIMTRKITKWIVQSPEDFCNDDMLKGYERNKALIDFDCIPVNIQRNVIAEYRKQRNGHNKGTEL